MRRAVLIGSLFVLAVVAGGGCSDDAASSGNVEDASDGSVDGAVVPRTDGGAAEEAGTDATATDAGADAPSDAATEAGSDAASDAETEAGGDAANDAETEAGGDAAIDAADASGDATGDAGTDANAPAQHVGGHVAGLLAGSVVLVNNAGDDRTVMTNGAFTFATPVTQGGMYDVSVKTQPPGQSCTVTSGKGSVATSDITSVAVTCVDTLDCPAGSSGTKQSICGRLYDLADDAAVQADTSCTPCGAATSTGPCSLKITAYDLLAFSLNPATAPPLTATESMIDTCGRFRLRDVGVPASGALVLLVDDASGFGSTGNTVTVAVAIPAAGGTATKNVDGWIAAPALTQGWQTSGGPALSGGIYVPIFRPHGAGSPDVDRALYQSGVTVTSAGAPVPSQDNYFGAAAVSRTTLDAAATATGANGTALVTGASIAQGVAYSGSGGLSDPTNCRWELKAAASIPSVLWVQIFRPTDQVGKTCSL